MRLEKGNFAQIPNIHKLSELSANAQLAFLWFCVFADNDGVCFPSHKALCERMGRQKSTVIKAVKELEKAGMIAKRKEFRDDGSQKANSYQIYIIEKGVKGGCNIYTGGYNKNTPLTISRELKKEDSKLSSKRMSETDFAHFWTLYPRKVSKAKSWLIFRKLEKSMLAEICSALEQQKCSEQWTRDGGKFIPYPNSWLNGKRWEDELEIKQKPKSSRFQQFNPNHLDD